MLSLPSWTRSLLCNIFFSPFIQHTTLHSFEDLRQAAVTWSFLRGFLNHCPLLVHSSLSPAMGGSLSSPGCLSILFNLSPPPNNCRYFMELLSSGEIIISCLMSCRPLGKSCLGMVWWHGPFVSPGLPRMAMWNGAGGGKPCWGWQRGLVWWGMKIPSTFLLSEVFLSHKILLPIYCYIIGNPGPWKKKAQFFE